MKIVLLGAPGCGKGTQAQKLQGKTGLVHISTGNIFREEVAGKTALGLKAKAFMDKGTLVPDDVVVSMVEERLKRPDCQKGFILDGFPRTTNQAVAFDNSANGSAVDWVLYYEAKESVLVRRLTGRRTCPKCGALYHAVSHPPKAADKCDKCQTTLVIRPDDKEDVVVKRLAVYEKETRPLIDYYKPSGRLIDIDADRTEDEIFIETCEQINIPVG